MRIGIIDADLIGRQKHRFPNLACEKLSGYWKCKGAEVDLLLSYDEIGGGEQSSLFEHPHEDYDHIYISKVFTDTLVPQWVDDLKYLPPDETRKIQIGGTGFYFDQAPPLPDEIEHHMPDYYLYDEWIAAEVKKAEELAKAEGRQFNQSRFMVQFKEYTD